jgi:hypothetical protein
MFNFKLRIVNYLDRYANYLDGIESVKSKVEILHLLNKEEKINIYYIQVLIYKLIQKCLLILYRKNI